MTERVGVYRWSRPDEPDAFCTEYPVAAEQYDDNDVSILFWDAGRGG